MRLIKDKIIEIEEIEEESDFVDIHTETLNYIAENIVVHNCSPHKKSFSTGVYMPNLVREKIEIVVGVDTSGSIGQKELQEFVSEVVGIGNSFSNIEMDLLFCDSEVHNEYVVTRDNLNEIMDFKIAGGGGTSVLPIVEWINDNKPQCKVFIYITDGYSDIESSYDKLPDNCRKLIVLPLNSKEPKQLEQYGEVIRIE